MTQSGRDRSVRPTACLLCNEPPSSTTRFRLSRLPPPAASERPGGRDWRKTERTRTSGGAAFGDLRVVAGTFDFGGRRSRSERASPPSISPTAEPELEMEMERVAAAVALEAEGRLRQAFLDGYGQTSRPRRPQRIYHNRIGKRTHNCQVLCWKL